MKLHVSLRWPASVLLIGIWATMALFTVAVSAGGAMVLIAPAMVAGGVGGAMQAASIRSMPDAFRRARSALDVRRAFRGTVWGARYLVLFWAVQTMFLIVALALAWGPLRRHDSGLAAFQMLWAYASLYSGFALTREIVSLTELPGLSRG